MSKPCKDCPAESKRPAPHPGPRCATHHREVVKARRTKAHGAHVEKTYGITTEQYWALHLAQGGVCYICQRATGRARKLSVDHDHACCPGPVSCGRCVRALLCRPCNDLLGHVRDDIDTLRRAAIVIRDRPAQEILLRF